MSRAWLIALLLAGGPVRLARSQDSPAPVELSLEQALDVAFQKSPRLRVERARVAEAMGRLTSAETYPFNPEVEIQGAGRFRDGRDSGDFTVAVAQEIEIAGQRGRRIDAAQAEVEAVRATERRTSRLLAAEVHVVFVEAVEARELLEVARAESDLARQFLDLARRRLAAGEGTQLDVNVAAAELGRAEQAVGVEEGRYAAARAFLAETLGLQAATLPVPTGPLDPPMDEPPALDALLVDVEANRADLQALRETERAARGHVDRARAEAWPDLRLGLFSGVEEGRDALVGVSVALPLPVFARNQGAIAEAEAAVARVVAERDAARLSAVREVVVAWEQHRARARALTILRDRVLGTSEENLELLRKAFEAGKTGWVEVLVMRKALFDARRALLETSADLRRARVAIDIAAGRMPLPPGAGAR